MKRINCLLLTLSLIIASMGLTSQASNIETTKGTISVSTSSNMEMAPDVAEISFAVQTSDLKSMQRATALNKEISDKVYAELKSLIDIKNGDYIKTADFSANPVYSYVNSKKTFERFEVSNRVIVHTKSINKIGKIIDNTINVGATNVDNLVFSVSDYETQCNELIAKSVQKAKTRADFAAKALNSSVIGISNIHTNCNANNYNPPRLYTAKNMISDLASESVSGNTSISNGIIKINANVNASFFVE